MNKIINSNNKTLCITEDGTQLEMKIWLEKSKNKEHYVFTMPSLNTTGRQYFSRPTVDAAIAEKGAFEFETKTSEPRKIGNWRDRLTEEELAELKAAEETIEWLKDTGLNRKPKTEADLLKEKIAAQEKELAELRKLLGK